MNPDEHMNPNESRPPVAVAHVVLETDRMEQSAGFMQSVGMRPVFLGPQVSVLELRGGTHLILMRKDSVTAAVTLPPTVESTRTSCHVDDRALGEAYVDSLAWAEATATV